MVYKQQLKQEFEFKFKLKILYIYDKELFCFIF